MTVLSSFFFYLPSQNLENFKFCSLSHFLNPDHDVENKYQFSEHFLSSYLFIEFDKFWLECQPKDIMEFNRIRDLFENIVRTKLADNTTCFKVNIEVDTV